MTVELALKELADEIKSEIIARVWEEGVNPKTNTNTLIYSDLIKNMRVDVASDNAIVFQIADYYEYVVLGWRRTRRFKGTFSSFIQNLLVWMRKKNVHSSHMNDNNLAWAIAMNIMKGGLMPRPFINYDKNDDVSKILPFLDEFFEKWADDLFDKIMEKTDNYFNG